MRTAATHTVVFGGGDHGSHRRVFRQPGQLSQIARACAVRPVLHACHGTQHLRIQRHFALVHLPQAVQAQITGAPLEACNTQGQAQGLYQARQIAQIQLVLQGLGGRRNHHPFATEQRRHQIREGFSHPGARLHHQHPPGVDGVRHRHRHGRLPRARAEMWLCTREPAVLRKSGCNLVVQIHGGVIKKKRAVSAVISRTSDTKISESQ